jgi:hypothetical protein
VNSCSVYRLRTILFSDIYPKCANSDGNIMKVRADRGFFAVGEYRKI